MIKPKLASNNSCTGCGVCSVACKMQAILMQADNRGFLYPIIDESKCIGCKKCESVCPVLNKPMSCDNVKTAFVGVHKDRNVLTKSSSGGAFSAIVECWNPDYVCGVCWNGFDAINEISEKKDYEVFLKSKYILSDSNGIYEKAKRIIQEGYKVLFSGTPCQVAAFKNYLGDENSNVLLVDIVCHGAPSANLLKQHILELEKKKHKSVISWSFRDKTLVAGKVSSRSAIVYYSDGTSEHLEINQDAFLQLYYERIAYRVSCGNCLFAEPNRISDITICDAHHIDEVYSELCVDEGVSAILFHTHKAYELYEKLKSIMELRTIDYNWMVEHNQQLHCPTIIHPKTDKFYKLLDKGESFEKSINKTLKYSFIEKLFIKMGIK